METFIKFIAWYFTALALFRLFTITTRKYPHTRTRSAALDSVSAVEYAVIAVVAWTLLR